MKKIISSFAKLLPRDFVFCDVGARGGIPPPWNRFDPLIRTIGFEPDKVEFDRLAETGMKGKIFNCALSKDSQDRRLYLTRERGSSSLYEPDTDYLKQFPGCGRFEVEDSVIVKTVGMDELFRKEGINGCDFIKIDVQGAELDVLKGGVKFLKEHVLGVEAEVEFQPIYRNQPLFGEVDSYIREQFGMELQDLKKYYWKYPEGVDYGSAKGKLIFGEALYFRSPENIIKMCENRSREEAGETILMAMLMGVVYGYFDYALSLLRRSRDGKYFEKDRLTRLESAIRSYGKGIRYTSIFAGNISEGFRLLYKLFQPIHEGWASNGQPLGSRKKFGTFF